HSPGRRDPHSFPTRRSSDLGQKKREGETSVKLTAHFPTPAHPPGSGRALRRRVFPAKERDSPIRDSAMRDGRSRHRRGATAGRRDRKSTRLNSSHLGISYAV